MTMWTCTVHCLDCLTIPVDIVRMADVMITDPPYSADVHDNAVSCSAVKGATKRPLGFESLTHSAREKLNLWAGQVKRWSVIFSDVESAHLLRGKRHGLETTRDASDATYIRTIPWVRWSMPQLSGDRPTQGHESIVVLHSTITPGPKRWNGRGGLMAFEADDTLDTIPRLDAKCLRGEGKHKAEKPIDLCLDLVSWFSDPGETVFDPFAGSGAIGLACRLLGRSYVGCEIDPQWCWRANQRLSLGLSDRDRDRVTTWLAYADNEKNEGPALARRARREADKERVRCSIEK